MHTGKRLIKYVMGQVRIIRWAIDVSKSMLNGTGQR